MGETYSGGGLLNPFLHDVACMLFLGTEKYAHILLAEILHQSVDRYHKIS